MNAAIAQWIELLPGGVMRIELWELATPQQQLATYDPRATLVAAIANEVALRVNEPMLAPARKRVGHALFAYVTDTADEEACALALVRDGVLCCADFSERPEDRVLSMLLHQCERFARHARVLDDAGFVQTPPSPRKATRRSRASGLRPRSK